MLACLICGARSISILHDNIIILITVNCLLQGRHFLCARHLDISIDKWVVSPLAERLAAPTQTALPGELSDAEALLAFSSPVDGLGESLQIWVLWLLAACSDRVELLGKGSLSLMIRVLGLS